MELKNYPSGDKKFDDWFRSTEPQWAAEIDAQIAKDEAAQQLAERLADFVAICENNPMNVPNSAMNIAWNLARAALAEWDKATK